MKKVVISLGGSVLVQDKINVDFLKKFKKIILNFGKNNKVVIVTGGGKTTRTYINGLREVKLDEKELSLMGIRITRLNALFLTKFFFPKTKYRKVPMKLKNVTRKLKKENIVICGALEYEPDQTSDGTAAEVAERIKADYLMNITNVKGLYDKDPGKYRNANLIKKISWQDFLRIVNKLKFMAGQHFILDKNAAIILSKRDIDTFIVKDDIKQIENILRDKAFIGTSIVTTLE